MKKTKYLDLKKNCITCGVEFSKRVKDGWNRWNNRKYCADCRPPQNNKYSLKNLTYRIPAGSIPWNLGVPIAPKLPRNEEHPRFIDGVNFWGYRRVNTIGKRVLEHRLVMEKELGRKLGSWEHVHHIDGDKLNNDPLNLLVLTNSEHRKLHKNFKQYA